MTRYVALVDGKPGSYGLTVPDLPGCTSAAATIDEVLRRATDAVRLWVEDNGIGIAPQHHERIFKIFERLHTSKKYDGTGVGLAIVQRIVHRHGGRIWAEAVLNRGATFYFTLNEDIKK